MGSAFWCALAIVLCRIVGEDRVGLEYHVKLGTGIIDIITIITPYLVLVLVLILY